MQTLLALEIPHRLPLTHSPPPPTREFNWCYNCTYRCQNVLESLKFHALNINNRVRALKFRSLAASLPKFFRGTDHLYLEDVFNIPYSSKYFNFNTLKTRTIVNADLHTYNFGAFDNSRMQIIYDQNDFDQVMIGDYQVCSSIPNLSFVNTTISYIDSQML